MQPPSPIIIPYIDCVDLTLQAVADCLDQTGAPSPILLIDNGSQPEGREIADELRRANPARILPWHHLPPLPSLSATWNRALRFCWEAGAESALVINNDVRLAPWTYALLSEVQQKTGAWFVTAVSVTAPQFEAYRAMGEELARAALGTITDSRKDGVRPEGISYGGPDFSCYLITKECHRWFQFDEDFIPAYHEDNDFHRRLGLAGFGDRIFGVNLPFLHYGSATINRTPEIAQAWQTRFRQCQDYYRRKWGGLPGQETFLQPFNASGDARHHMTGQGRAPWTLPTEQLFDASHPAPLPRQD